MVKDLAGRASNRHYEQNTIQGKNTLFRRRNFGCISGVLSITGTYDNNNMSHTFCRSEAIMKMECSFHYTNT